MTIELPVWFVVLVCAGFMVQTWKIYSLHNEIRDNRATYHKSIDGVTERWRKTVDEVHQMHLATMRRLIKSASAETVMEELRRMQDDQPA